MFIIIPTQVYLSKSAPVQVLCWTRFSISETIHFPFFRCEYHHDYNTCCHAYDSILFILIKAKYSDVHHHSNSSISVKISTCTSSMLDQIFHLTMIIWSNIFSLCVGYLWTLDVCLLRSIWYEGRNTGSCFTLFPSGEVIGTSNLDSMDYLNHTI